VDIGHAGGNRLTPDHGGERLIRAVKLTIGAHFAGAEHAGFLDLNLVVKLLDALHRAVGRLLHAHHHATRVINDGMALLAWARII